MSKFTIGKIDKNAPEEIKYVGHIGSNNVTDTYDYTDNISLDGAYRVCLSGSYAFIATNKLRTFGDSDTSSTLSHWGH